MDPIVNAVLGGGFLLLAFASTFLMFHLWGYPYDHETHVSSAPAGLMRVHRLIGYAYLAIYVFLMAQMLPRLWVYQIEFPARTVAHLSLGMAIGVILIVKVAIVRFFKHLESATVPFLGILLLISTTLLMGLSLPFTLHEEYLMRTAFGGQSILEKESLDRVRKHLETAGLTQQLTRNALATPRGLRHGRSVLSRKCVLCHDLRTILARPHTPEAWRQIVERMADRSALFEPIPNEEQWAVTAYLIAISPDLQSSVKRLRAEEIKAEKAQEAVRKPPVSRAAPVKAAAAQAPAVPAVDPEADRRIYEAKCALCHPLSIVEKARPTSEEDARAVVARMVKNGMRLPEPEIEAVVRHLTPKK
ncbi:MAG: hypothetical protein FJW39_00605 [Acidobacteria bacterium]|nr:hypothetical protein [Acidobacteriota bacterium]